MKNKDKPVYPIHWTDHEGNARIDSGLTKREYFAGLAMQGILQNLGIADKSLAKKQMEYYSTTYPNCTGFECVAKESIAMADELLKQLSHDH
jgi:hypothetical protein